MYKNILLTCCCVLLGVAGSASATDTVIQPTAVVSDEYAYDGNSSSHLITNTGMVTEVNDGDTLASALAAEHASNDQWVSFFSTDPGGYPSDFFGSLGADTDVDIVLDLGADKALGSILLWQYSYSAPEGNHTQTLEVRINTDAEGSATFAGSATTVTLLKTSELGGVNLAQQFALDAVTTGRYVQLSLMDNYYDPGNPGQGGDRVGLGEVRFASEVPEPATMALLGLGGLLLRRRKK